MGNSSLKILKGSPKEFYFENKIGKILVVDQNQKNKEKKYYMIVTNCVLYRLWKTILYLKFKRYHLFSPRIIALHLLNEKYHRYIYIFI